MRQDGRAAGGAGHEGNLILSCHRTSMWAPAMAGGEDHTQARRAGGGEELAGMMGGKRSSRLSVSQASDKLSHRAESDDANTPVART
jgi:hypothetical protein